MSSQASGGPQTELVEQLQPSARRIAGLLMILVSTTLHGIFLSKATPLQSANDRSRWSTVWSLVERGTFQIDEIRQRPGWDTIDLVRVDGHFYSTKPPLFTTIVAGLTWIVQRVTGWDLLQHTQSVTFAVLLLTNLLPFAVSLVIWAMILERISSNAWTQLFGLSVAAFGTLLTPFLMTLNNHTIAAAAVMIALYAVLVLLQQDASSRTVWPYALSGFALAWAFANELPAASLAGLGFLLALSKSPRKTMVYFLPAAAVPLIAIVVTNVIATGSWKPFYADYGTDKYRFVVDGIPSYWMEPHGVDKNLDSPWGYFVHCTVGHHGIFSLSPIWVLLIIGWLICARIKERATRTLVVCSAITTAAVIAFYMTRTQNYNYGGVSCGLRWALWLIPLWLVSIVSALDLISRWRFARVLAMGLLVMSMYSAWQPIENPWRQPWLFQWMEARGWIDYSDDRPELSKPLWTWFASLPDVTKGESAWIEFSVAQLGLEPRIVRLTAQPRSAEDKLLALEVRQSSGDDPSSIRIRKLLIDIEEFNKGSGPADFLNWSDPNVTSQQQQDDLAFVRGLPSKVPYSARTIRYLKTSLRPEALRCTLTVAHVSYSPNETDPPLNYRCDTWLTDDVPFGVAQVEFHISTPNSKDVRFHERWTIRDCWPKVSAYK